MNLRITEAARAAGVNKETLRYYERRGLLEEPVRSPGGHRLYSDHAVQTLRIIKAAQRLGFTLGEVADLLEVGKRRGRTPGLQDRARDKLAEVERRMSDLADHPRQPGGGDRRGVRRPAHLRDQRLLSTAVRRDRRLLPRRLLRGPLPDCAPRRERSRAPGRPVLDHVHGRWQAPGHDRVHPSAAAQRPLRAGRPHGASFVGVDLANVSIRGSDLTGLRVRGSDLSDIEINGWLDGPVHVNGVDVGPLVDAELDRRYPERAKMRPGTADGFREAWDVLERLWAETVERARRLDPPLLHESVDGEWSFIETLRHLVFATDAWIRRAILGDPAPWHPLDLPWDEMPDTPGVPRDRDARPSLDEVLELRADRMATVRECSTAHRRAAGRSTEPVDGRGLAAVATASRCASAC